MRRGPRAQRSQALRGLPLPQGREGRDRLQVLRLRPDLALFPVVDGLRRRPDQQRAIPRRKPEPPSLRRQTLRTESALGRRRVVRSQPCRRRGLPPGSAQPPQLLFESLRSALQRGELGAMHADRLFESRRVRADLFACDARNFTFEDVRNIWHPRIVTRCGSRLSPPRTAPSRAAAQARCNA